MAQRVRGGDVLAGRFRLTESFVSDPSLDVWLADDLELRREVVIKVLHPRRMDNETMTERFRFEALAAARLDHDNIARTYDVHQSDGVLFTVSEYVPGPSVSELLEDGPFPATVVAALGQQAAAGLAAAHHQGLVHRAICPDNLVVAPTGRLCIIDFGSVRDIEGGDEHLPEPVFHEPGMSAYWPPERHAGATVDHRGDVFSLGLVMWEALTGVPEVGSRTPDGPVRRLLAGLPGGDTATPRLVEILAEATDEDPPRRPPAVALADALVEISGVRPQEYLEAVVADHQASR